MKHWAPHKQDLHSATVAGIVTADLCRCTRNHKVPGDATPVPLAKLGEAHQEQTVLLLSPGNALPPLSITATL